jgi:C-terminal processing protease CtpA/Prc
MQPQTIALPVARSTRAIPSPCLLTQGGRELTDFEQNLRLAEIVGSPTAGANASFNGFTVPGGFEVRFTGMKVLKQNGSQHHGIGIRPTLPAERTRAGVAAGIDEVLERALSLLRTKP